MESTKFDIADYLDSKEMIAEYLNEILEEGNEAEILSAIGHIAKAIGMTKIAEETGLSRKGIQKALSGDGNPEFASVNAIIHAMGYRLSPQKLNT